jgi:zinc transport system substrate-binding protein
MKKLLFSAGLLAVVALGIFALVNQAQKPKNDATKIIVVTTLFPLYDFAQNIGQDKVEVSLLLPPGVEPHSFEPKPSDIAKISKADVFVYTGKFMEPWAEDIIKGISGRNVKVVDSSADIKIIPAVFYDKDEPKGSMDPHIWLDFDNAKIIVDNIAQALSEKDTANADYYKQKAGEYKDALSMLDNKYKAALSSCKSKEIVYGGHYAFGYLARRYGLQYLAAQGISPDAEPTAQDLIRLVQQIKKDNIRYVFYEELTNTKIAETLVNETQAKMLPLNAAHNITKKDFENKVSFLSIMENNLRNLKLGLHCEE